MWTGYISQLHHTAALVLAVCWQRPSPELASAGAACPTVLMAQFDGVAMPWACSMVGETRYGHGPRSGLGGMGQSPEDFDSASLEEEQGMAGGVLAGTGLMEGGQRTVWKGSVTWKPRGDLALRDPGLSPHPQLIINYSGEMTSEPADFQDLVTSSYKGVVLGTRAFLCSFLYYSPPSFLLASLPFPLFPSFGNWSVIDIQKSVCV